jgi:ketosteroid isomerase-like protein
MTKSTRLEQNSKTLVELRESRVQSESGAASSQTPSAACLAKTRYTVARLTPRVLAIVLADSPLACVRCARAAFFSSSTVPGGITSGREQRGCPLATDRRGAEAEREWLRELFRRLPGLRFEVEDMIVEGGPWSTRVATRYAALQNGQVVYRGVNFGRVVWGKIVEERILPDTQALAAALA